MRHLLSKVCSPAGFLALCIVFSGCSGLLGSRYNNFRAYYNTFYNARKAFDTGEENLARFQQQVDRDKYISVFPAQQSGGGSPQFEEAIEKSADLLRERPGTKWTDDALLLIGKSYFYQHNFVGAEGKFRETIEAANASEQEELVDEARFWLVRTLVAGEQYDQAEAILDEGIARPGIKDKWRARMELVRGEMHVQQQNWLDASSALEEGIAIIDDSDLAGRAQFLLAQVYQTAGQFEDAAAAYEAVDGHNPIYELSYAAQLSRALVTGIDEGQFDEGLDLIQRIRRDDKNYAHRAEVELAHARLLAASGQLQEAQELFYELLYGDDIRITDRGEAYYYYGKYFQASRNDYVRASAYYDSAATAIRSEPSREDLVTPVAIVGVQRTAEVYRTFANISTQIAETDSLMVLGRMNEDEFADAIEEIEHQRMREWQEEQRRLEQRRAEQGFGNTPIIREGGGRPGGRNEGSGGEGEGSGIDSGYLNYLDPARVQDGLLNFQSYWGDRVLAPNWRRQSALDAAAAQANTDGTNSGQDPGQVGVQSGGPPPLDLSSVPRTADALADMRSERAQLRYELGNVMFLSLAEPDSAVFWYSRVVDEDPDEPVAIRAQYALAEVHQSEGDTTRANELYHVVLDMAPESDLAAQARERLGLQSQVEQQEDSADDQLLSEYAEIFDVWERAHYQEAFTRMLLLAKDRGVESIIPRRALLASAEIYAEWALEENFDVMQPITDSLIPGWLQAEVDSLRTETGETPIDTALAHDPAHEPGFLEEHDAQDPAIDSLGAEVFQEDQLEEEGQPEAEEMLNQDVEDDSVEVDSVEEFKRRRLQVVEENPVVQDQDLDASPIQVVEADPVSPEAPDPTPQVFREIVVHELGTTTLSNLYLVIQERYPGTNFAQRASQLRSALLSNTSTTTGEPSETNGTIPSPDSTDSGGRSLPEAVINSAPEGTFGLYSGRPMDPVIGGFSWKVATVPSPLAARALLNNFRSEGLKAEVTMQEGDRGTVYVLLLGQYPSEQVAEEGRDELPSTGVGRNVEIVSLGELVFVSPEELGNE